MAPIVCTTPAAAAGALARGDDVVLVTPGAAGAGTGPGRLALFVGDPASLSDCATAGEMAAEVFARDNAGRDRDGRTIGGQ